MKGSYIFPQAIEGYHSATVTGSPISNSRKFPRFRPQNDIYALHDQIGKVVEISMGGIVFEYYARSDDTLPTILPSTGLLFDLRNQHIADIPFELISDVIFSSFISRYKVIRQRRIKFKDLTANQVDHLENFILSNSYIPQLEHGT